MVEAAALRLLAAWGCFPTLLQMFGCPDVGPAAGLGMQLHREDTESWAIHPLPSLGDRRTR